MSNELIHLGNKFQKAGLLVGALAFAAGLLDSYSDIPSYLYGSDWQIDDAAYTVAGLSALSYGIGFVCKMLVVGPSYMRHHWHPFGYDRP